MNNSETPQVSIIVPIYKAEAYLKKCLDSILKQSFTDFEVILVDDGSPDKCGEICENFALADKRVKVIHKENGGVASARQVGLASTTGTYVIHIDPDDWIEQNMLKDMVELAIAEGLDIVIADFYVDYGSKIKYFSNNFKSLQYRDVLNQIIKKSCAFMWNKLIKRECYYRPGEISWEVGINHFEDMIACTKLLQYPRRIGYLPQAYYHYTQNVNPNALIQHSKSFYEYRLKLNERIIPLFDKERERSTIYYLLKQEAFAALKEKKFRKNEFLAKYAFLKEMSNDWYGERMLKRATSDFYYPIQTYLIIDDYIRRKLKGIIFNFTNMVKK